VFHPWLVYEFPFFNRVQPVAHKITAPAPELRSAGGLLRKRDVVVLGGGPAGAAAAIAMARAGLGVVLLLRPGNAAPARCETLPPEIRLPLTELGLWEQFQAGGPVRSPGFVSAWGGPELGATDTLFNPYGPGWHVDRGRFDAMLLAAATGAGVTVRRDDRLTRVAGGPSGGCELEAVSGGRSVVWRAPFLIDATGRAATPARRLGGRRLVFDRLVGLVGTITSEGSISRERAGKNFPDWEQAGVAGAERSDAPEAPNRGIASLCPSHPPLDRRDESGSDSWPLREPRSDRRALVEAVEDGWWYSASFPDGRRLALAFFTDADLVPRGQAALVRHWWAMLRQAPFTAGRCGTDGRLDRLRLVSANTTRASRFGGPGWLAAGDAAATLDPLCGQGVFLALESALRAAAAVVASLRGASGDLEDYLRHVDDGFTAYLRERSAWYEVERRWPGSPFWQRRQATEWEG